MLEDLQLLCCRSESTCKALMSCHLAQMDGLADGRIALLHWGTDNNQTVIGFLWSPAFLLQSFPMHGHLLLHLREAPQGDGGSPVQVVWLKALHLF